MDYCEDSSKDLLSLCYDTFTELAPDRFAVSIQGKYGIIDSKNNVLLPFGRDEIERIGPVVTMKNGADYYTLDLDTMRKTGRSFKNPYAFGDALIVRDFNSGFHYGVLNKYGKWLMPPIYNSIKFNGQYDDVYKLWVSYNEHSFIDNVSL